MSSYNKYLKYKLKYINLKKYINQIGGSKCEICHNEPCDKTLYCEINNIPETSIIIETLNGDDSKDIELIIIPGFSDSSYDRNYKTLFEYYDIKLDINKFDKVHLIKFQDNENFSIRKLHGKFFSKPDNKIINPQLENELYKKLADIIHNKLKSIIHNKLKYTILAKSAGGGVGIYLSEKIPEHINKLLLFAPGIGYINNELKELKLDKDKIIIGWNIEDTKVKFGSILPVLEILLLSKNVLLYTRDIKIEIDTKKEIDTQIEIDTKKEIDTQHEINSQFIKLLNEIENEFLT